MKVTFLDPGALRTELDLQMPIRSEDALGGGDLSWMTVATVFGLLEPVGATQFFRSEQDVEVATHTIIIRYRDGVTSGMRFAKGNRTFQISTVADVDETGRYLICRCEEDLS